MGCVVKAPCFVFAICGCGDRARVVPEDATSVVWTGKRGEIIGGKSFVRYHER
ncbi:hypothetical protein ALPO108162_06110 [Alicyclobacillus pomorum]|jgi:hypothetical protein